MFNSIKNVSFIQKLFAQKFRQKQFEKNGTVEIVGAHFIADKPSIFGKPDNAYIKAEIEWYESESLNISDLKNPPAIWKSISSESGKINSNYGWCIYSKENGNQFTNAIVSLKTDHTSRQAVMIYTRPGMHVDAFKDGMSDFMCTNTVQLLIRNNRLIYIVDMRSNDAVFGYKNDYAWHSYVQKIAFSRLKPYYPDLKLGEIIWKANSLHVYERHYGLIESYMSGSKK